VTVRAFLYEEDQARLVADRLRAGGFGVSVGRERFAGEDDDEDHPWTVLTDAPSFMVEVLVDEYDGWVDDMAADTPPTPPAPLDLPAAPHRVKGRSGAP
jgi:hypothetical protein